MALWLAKKKKKNSELRATTPPPLLLNCFQCQTKIFVKWVIPSRDYSKKNCWNYWTESVLEKDRKKHICNICLKTLYYDKLAYWEVVKNPKKRKLLTVYIHEKRI